MLKPILLVTGGILLADYLLGKIDLDEKLAKSIGDLPGPVDASTIVRAASAATFLYVGMKYVGGSVSVSA